MNKSIPLLALCQAIVQSASIHLTTTGALIGLQLSGSEKFSTWPAALSVVGVLIATIPASYLMGRFGRRAGFLLALLLGVTGVALAATAIFLHAFALFCGAALVMGLMLGFAGYFRFAAVELVPATDRARAISLVLAGGVLAAIAGPSLSGWGRGIFPEKLFLGGYLLWLPLSLIAVALIFLIPFKPAARREISLKHSLSHLFAHARFPSIMVLSSGAYVVMATVMTATPLAMHHHHLGFDATSDVIRGHMLGMFVPSFFTGQLIRRFGAGPIAISGGLIYVLTVAINFMGVGYWQFMSSLILLGVAWNFLFVSASQLLVAEIGAEHQSTAQALNDFVIALTMAASVAFTGKIHEAIGWQWLNLAALPVIGLLFIAAIFPVRKQIQG